MEPPASTPRSPSGPATPASLRPHLRTAQGSTTPSASTPASPQGRAPSTPTRAAPPSSAGPSTPTRRDNTDRIESDRLIAERLQKEEDEAEAEAARLLPEPEEEEEPEEEAEVEGKGKGKAAVERPTSLAEEEELSAEEKRENLRVRLAVLESARLERRRQLREVFRVDEYNVELFKVDEEFRQEKGKLQEELKKLGGP